MSGSWHPKQASFVTLLLIGATCITVPMFLLICGVVVFCRLTEPASFPGDPDNGGGLLLMAAGILIVPVLLGWGLWLGARL